MKHVPAPLVGVGLPDVHLRTMEALNEILTDYIKTGFYFTHGDWYDRHKGMPLLNVANVRSHAREIAKELKRPFIVVDGRWSYWAKGEFSSLVTLPSQKRMEVFMTPIYLQGVPVERYYEGHKQTVGYRNNPSITNIWFTGEKGRQAFDAWFKYTQNQPECRKVLKLDTTQ